ncbi:tripartite tricarboxylate transporter substrate binding protein [Bordetella bronchiseptica]|uniref:tripartite tricarboxylate transporter substrate binding protein n=1 Tax=Bordetella bronchiseptica TaxID=518 RepID=UPI000460FE40|nr:tripartite tricarboxylate transporter substrate binding protein [Bordetella bronchiseptica]KDC63589.1 tripartite tricarboxylate transporter family receptor [Bordetella bronchiseptica MBORD595]VEF45358.1 Argininosuccinate lyase [Bordetella bronchiseptica]
MIRSLLVGLLLTLGPAAAQAAESPDRYPSKPITIIVPFSAGGPADNVTRYIANQLGKTWNQQVVVENRTGAGGMIGAEAAARAAPDGYHLVLLVTGHTIMPGMQASMPYRMPQDFTGITVVNRAPKLVVVHPSVPVASFAELIEKVKQEPGKYGSYGTSGVGSMAHLSMELVNKLAGTKFVHIPYKGGGATQADLVAGRLPIGVLDLGSVLPHVQAGSLKVLAVTSDTRSPLFPDVPTIAEVIPNFQATEWFGIAGPKGVPPAIADKLQAAIKAALSTPEARTRYIEGLGWELPASTPKEMDEVLASQTVKWGALVKELGLKAQ